MSYTYTTKKPAPQDWHPADVVAAIWKRGSSVQRLSRLRGYAGTTLSVALRHPYPKAEKIIADFLGVKPQEIWPSRYDRRGKSNRHRGGYHPKRNVSAAPVIRRQRAA